MYQLSHLANQTGLVHGISERVDGNMAFALGDAADVVCNRETFLRGLGITLADCVFMNLEHGTRVTTVNQQHRGSSTKTAEGAISGDALITNERGIFLCLLTGDCLPVIFYDPKRAVVALVHLGWKSSAGGLAVKVVETMHSAFHCDPAEIIVGIGPGIHKESYRLPTPAVVQRKLSDWNECLTDFPDGQTAIDLVGYNVKRLLDVDIRQDNIEVSPVDTATSDSFFSYYRSKRSSGKQDGRFLTVVGIRSMAKPV